MTREHSQRWIYGGLTALTILSVCALPGLSAPKQNAPQNRQTAQNPPAFPPAPGEFQGGPNGQNRPGGFPGGQGGPGGPGGGFPGGPGGPGGFGGPGGPMMGGMMGGGGTAMTATGNRVYILRGNMLYAFDAANLNLIAKATLPQPEGRPGGPGGSGGPGGEGR